MRLNHKHLFTLLFITTLNSCMVGPDFHSPIPPKTKKYTASSLPTKTVGKPQQHLVMGGDIPSKWWHLFHSPLLNKLICIGLINNQTLQAAKASLTQAQETLTSQTDALLFPQVNANINVERQRFSGSSFGITKTPPRIFNLINPSLSVSYLLDIFGGSRRELESLKAQMDYQQFELEAAYLTLTSNIVTTTVTAASL